MAHFSYMHLIIYSQTTSKLGNQIMGPDLYQKHIYIIYADYFCTKMPSNHKNLFRNFRLNKTIIPFCEIIDKLQLQKRSSHCHLSLSRMVTMPASPVSTAERTSISARQQLITYHCMSLLLTTLPSLVSYPIFMCQWMRHSL